MKVNYEELMQYYEAARYKTPGEWKDAIEAILDAVPRIVKEHEKLEAENAEQRQQAFEDGFVLGAKLIELTLEGAFKMFGGDELGLPPISYDEEVEEGKTFCWNMYKDAGKETVLAHFQKMLDMLK